MDSFSYLIYLLVIIPLYFILKGQYAVWKNRKLLTKLKLLEPVIRHYYLGQITNYEKVAQAIKGHDFPEKREINNIVGELFILNKKDPNILD